MTKIALPSLAHELELRIQKRIRRYQPGDKRLKEALLRIGFLLEGEAKLNVRRKGIIDTGRLLNSIRHELFRTKTTAGVRVGSFGVPYAKLHEFGGPFTDRMRRAMFAKFKDEGRTNRINKNVIQGHRVIDRPYLRPALAKHKNRIVQIIIDMMR